MSKGKAEGVVVFQRGQDDSESSDMWDDSALIQAYDKAIGMAYDQINKDTREGQPSGNRFANDQSGRKKRKKKATGKANVKPLVWNVGDECFAQYAEDGEWYKAKILSIDQTNNTCRVLYDTYLNEEDQHLSNLQRVVDGASSQDESVPKEATVEYRQLNAESDNPTASTNETLVSSLPHFTAAAQTAMMSASASLLGGMELMKGPLSAIPRLPPPPPPPPSFRCKPAVDDEEALVSMLMSWYMSGYHTGYYQAMKDGKK